MKASSQNSKLIIYGTALFMFLMILMGSFASGSDPTNDLHQAVIKGDVEGVKRLVKLDPSAVNAKNVRGETPLLVAASMGNTEIIKLLVLAGSCLESENKFGMTPLLASIESNEYDGSLLIIDLGADVNHSSPFFGAPLHRASFYNNHEILAILLQKGATTEVRNRTQKTPLHEAARMGAVECMKILLENNADVNAIDIKGRTPIHYSIMAGIDLHDQNHSDTLAALLIQHGADLSAVDSSNATPLVYAVDNGMLNICKNLMENGSDPTIITPDFSRTLLHTTSIKGYTSISALLLQHHVDSDSKDSFGLTALQYAIEHGNDEIASMLSTDKIGAEDIESGKKYLNNPLADHEGYIWKMNHRGWAFKTSEYLIIFDYEENGISPEKPTLSNGWISPEEIQDQKVVVCYSTYHGKPGNMDKLHSLESLLPDMTFFHYKSDRWRGGENTILLDGTDTYLMENLKLETYETTDLYGMGSLGYIIQVNGISIFYSSFITEDKELFIRSIDNLSVPEAGITVAIIDIPPAIETFFSRYIIETLGPQHVILYSRQNNEKALDEHISVLQQEMPWLKIERFYDPGDHLNFSHEHNSKNHGP